jgi:lycopene beta-cyclase
MMSGRDSDIAILGGGLAGGLIALALARLRPELHLVLVERGERFGGRHV